MTEMTKHDRHRRCLGLLRRRTGPPAPVASARGADRRHLPPIRRPDPGAGLPEVRPSSARPDAALQRAQGRAAGQTGADRVPGAAARRRRRIRRAPAPAGCQVIDLSADFRVRSAAVYKEFYAHDHPAPGAAGPGGLRLAGGLSRPDQEGLADRLPGLLPDQHPAADHPAAESGPGPADGHHRRLAERRQRRGPQSRARLPLRRVQRERRGLTASPSTGTCRKSSRSSRSRPARR